MPWTLITQDEIDGLPDDRDAEAFVRFERICRDQMNAVVSRGLGINDSPGEVYFEYMAQVRGAALAYGFSDLADELPAPDFTNEAFNNFYSEVVAFVLKLGVQGRRERSSQSVELSTAAKARLQRQADALSEALEAADMPESRKAKLRDKLKEFTDELSKDRSSIARMVASFAIVVAALTPVVGLIGSSEEDIIKAPKVVEAIQKTILLIGHEKGVEIDHAPTPARASSPPKQLEDRSRGSRARSTSRTETFPADLDDEIPF